MDSFRKMWVLLLATAVAWGCVGLMVLTGIGPFVNGAAAILALITTMTIWSMWALDAYGISLDGTPQPAEKAKRDAPPAGDDRLALLLALLTPDERDAIRARLADELSVDGELSLADLLAEQEQAAASAQHDD